MMTKTEVKYAAQKALMQGMQTAFSTLREEYPEEEQQALQKAAREQMELVEKLFGYDVGSWVRGV